jgi:4-hydroxyphenylpyruvate dioxygenase-like putative hemolysin
MEAATLSPEKKENQQTDFLPLLGTDYVEFYVGNAKQAAHYYKTAFGFQSVAYAGPETGVKDRASYVVRQNKLTFVLTTPIRSHNRIADHIAKHGDGVKALALKVNDATNAWEETTKRGGKSFMEPTVLKDDDGEGCQHVALATNNIIETVTALKNRGVEFVKIPSSYYETVLDRVGHIDEDLKPLSELGILVDKDDEGYLLQIFSKPVEDRPTLFFEIIQRKGAKSFGKGNFKALFEAIEREQAERGNL